MESAKVLAEQEQGRSLYQKLKIDFIGQLGQGKIVNLNPETPKDMLNNIKTGIAYEALKEEDYKTAHAFFNQLGEEYAEAKNFTERMSWRKKEEKEEAKTLIEKVRKINDYKARFDFTREKVDLLAEKYDLVERVKDGKTSFGETIKNYEGELERISKLKKKEPEKEIKTYGNNLQNLIQIFKEFQQFNVDEESCQVDYFKKAKKIKKREKGGLITTMSGVGIAVSAIPALVIFPPVAFLLYAGGIVTAISGAWVGSGDSKYKLFKTEIAWKGLEMAGKDLDWLIHKSYITDYYTKNDELFKKTFSTMKEAEQSFIISELFKLKKKNLEVDEWLSQNYPKLVEDEGTMRLVNLKMEEEND